MTSATDTKDLSELEGDLQELGEISYRAERKANDAATELNVFRDTIKDQLNQISGQLAVFERQVPQLEDRLTENTNIDREQRKTLADLQSQIEQLRFTVAAIDKRLSPENGNTYETNMTALGELDELLSGDRDDETAPSYRKLRADFSDVTRSVEGDANIPSLDRFRNEYYASQNKSEGIQTLVSNFGPYLIAALASVAGWAVFDRFDALETAQASMGSRLQQIEYRVGDGNVEGTLEEEIDGVQELVADIESDFRQLNIDLLLQYEDTIQRLEIINED